MPDANRMPRNTLDFRVWGRYAMFTDPLTRVGGEKCSYHLPTYEALKGICKSIYWKPTLIWYVDGVRLMRRIRTQTRGMKPLDYVSGGNTLAIYTYLTGDARCETPADLTDGPGVEYQVRAHFEWNPHHPALAADRVEGKHFSIAQRSLERGGRRSPVGRPVWPPPSLMYRTEPSRQAPACQLRSSSNLGCAPPLSN